MTASKNATPNNPPWTKLVHAREAQGWSRFRLAAAMQINLSHLGKLERGEVRPRASTVSRAAKALGVPPASIRPKEQPTTPCTGIGDDPHVTHAEVAEMIAEALRAHGIG